MQFPSRFQEGLKRLNAIHTRSENILRLEVNSLKAVIYAAVGNVGLVLEDLAVTCRRLLTTRLCTMGFFCQMGIIASTLHNYYRKHIRGYVFKCFISCWHTENSQFSPLCFFLSLLPPLLSLILVFDLSSSLSCWQSAELYNQEQKCGNNHR